MRRYLILVFVAFALMAAAPASAVKGGNGKGHGKPTTTTTEVATSTTETATTTTEATTTTMPVIVCRAQTASTAGPITITQGGTYAGYYRSSDPAVPAVTINTNQPVVFDHACFEHAGHAIETIGWDADIDVHDSTFQKLPTELGAGSEQRAIYAYGAIRLMIDYNRFIDGDGVRWTDFDSTGAIEGSYTHNEVINVGRYQPTSLVQAIQLTEGTIVPDMEVAWNKITNTFGQSDAEDVISFVTSGGTSGHRIQVHHNLIDGSYPTVTGVFPFTGTGMNIGDGPGGPTGSSFIDAHDNWVIAYSNVGIGVTGGTDHEVYNNVVICTGRINGIISGSDFGNGINDNFGTNNVNKFIHNNTIGHLRPLDASTLVRNDTYFPSAASPFDVYDAADDAVHTPNTFMSPDPDDADYQQARDDWEAARVAAGVTIGPRP